MPEGGSKGGTGPAPRLPKEVKIELDKGQKVTIAVQKPAYFAALAAHREITADKVAALTGPVGELEEKSGVLAEKKVGKTGSTLTEAEARAVLETKIAEIQKAARQKFYTRDKNHLKLYQFKLGCSRQDMLDYANTAIIEAGKDSLPGITVDKLVAAAHARVDYINADASKKAAAGERKTVRAQLDSLRLLIKAAREEIQFAADAEWPHTAPANAEVRMEFLLDPNARFKG